MISNEKLKSISKGFKVGGMAAFGKKEDRDKFKKVLEKKGFKVGTFRSSGPVVGGGYKEKAFAVQVVGKRKQPMTRRRPARRNFNQRQLRIRNSPGGRFINKVQGLVPKAKTRRKNRGNFAKSSRRLSKNLDNVFSSL